jgi:hypothetical protein
MKNPLRFQPSTNRGEESILLRFLVQILAVIACICADMASGTKYSLVALPLMTAGAIWSYQRRHRVQTWMTRGGFLCAVAMVITSVISAFLGQTVDRIKQTGSLQSIGWLLLLTMLLVTFQMLRSWTLYYRVNLSNSLLLSTLLMSRAAATATSWGFVVVLCLFLALLLPALLLIYRSVLKLPPVGLSSIPSSAKHLTEQIVPWSELAKITIISVVVGGVLALFLPYFQMSQIGIDPPNLDKISEQLVDKLPFNQGIPGLTTQTVIVDGQNVSIDPTASPNLSAAAPAWPAPQASQLVAIQQDISTLAANAPPLTTAQSDQLQAQVQQLATAMNSSPTATNASPIADLEQVTTAANRLQEQLQKLQSPTPSIKPLRAGQSSPSITATPQPLTEQLQKELAALQQKINQSLASSVPSPSPSPSKAPEMSKEQQSQWTNIARVGVVLLALVAGLVWYLQQQKRQQKIQQRKDQSFNKLPTIERVYLLMLTELRKTGAHRPVTQTEWEFAQGAHHKYPDLLGQIIAEISGDYVAWRYGKQKISTAIVSEKFERFQQFHDAQLAKIQARP